MTVEMGAVNSLSNICTYDSSKLINEYFNLVSDDNNFTLLDKKLDSPYYDVQNLINKYSNTLIPLVLNVNIQCLNSKHAELVSFISKLELNNVIICAIVLQETWNFKYPELISIPGFQNIQSKLRTFSNGGGRWNFYKKWN